MAREGNPGKFWKEVKVEVTVGKEIRRINGKWKAKKWMRKNVAKTVGPPSRPGDILILAEGARAAAPAEMSTLLETLLSLPGILKEQLE